MAQHRVDSVRFSKECYFLVGKFNNQDIMLNAVWRVVDVRVTLIFTTFMYDSVFGTRLCAPVLVLRLFICFWVPLLWVHCFINCVLPCFGFLLSSSQMFFTLCFFASATQHDIVIWGEELLCWKRKVKLNIGSPTLAVRFVHLLPAVFQVSSTLCLDASYKIS